MAQQKKGLIARLLEGKERSEEYARSTLPTNRWQLFWDIFKGCFGKMFKVNLLILVFFIPVIAVVLIQQQYMQSLGILYPFGANLGVAYPNEPTSKGVFEYLVIQNDFMFGIVLIVVSIIAAVGLSGGMYVVRNMVWTEGIFVGNDFWRGVKLNFKNALQTALFFTIMLMLSKSIINLCDFTMATGDLSKFQEVMLTIANVMSNVFITLSLMMSLWMISLGVNYKMGFFVLLKNSFLMSIGTLPQTLFFGALALLPLILMQIGWSLLTIIAVVMIIIFGFSYALLVWLDFSQWVFDKYINPKIQGAKVGRGIFNKDGSSAAGADSAAAIEYQRMLLSHGRSRLVARPIKPIDDSLQVYDLPTSFTREDLKRLRESKESIVEDTEAYAEEHKNDLRYVEYNRQFEEMERAIQEEDDKKNKKKRGKKLKPPKSED